MPRSASTSSNVGPIGSSEKSRRWLVRSNAPGVPTNGRAMTRDTPCSPVSIARAASQAEYNSASGIFASCAATWKTESAEV